jgi:hypothetical protein
MITIQESDLSRIVEMAWEDRTPFEAIEAQFKLSEAQVKMNYGENEFVDVKPSIVNYVILLFSAHIARLNTNQSKS